MVEVEVGSLLSLRASVSSFVERFISRGLSVQLQGLGRKLRVQ